MCFDEELEEDDEAMRDEVLFCSVKSEKEKNVKRGPHFCELRVLSILVWWGGEFSAIDSNFENFATEQVINVYLRVSRYMYE